MSSANLRIHGADSFRVVVVHGGPGAAGEMAPVARRLSQEFGVREPLQTACSVDGQIEELRQELLTHAELPAVVVGFSWGAWLARLTDSEQRELAAAVEALEDPANEHSDTPLETLGRLASKADTYAALAAMEEPGDLRPDGGIYRAVWSEAAGMRRSGELLRRAQPVTCPVVAIHGDSDPSPAAGVSKPLSATLRDFRFVLLSHCGHTPWREQYAADKFYRILLSEIGAYASAQRAKLVSMRPPDPDPDPNPARPQPAPPPAPPSQQAESLKSTLKDEPTEHADPPRLEDEGQSGG